MVKMNELELLLFKISLCGKLKYQAEYNLLNCSIHSGWEATKDFGLFTIEYNTKAEEFI